MDRRLGFRLQGRRLRAIVGHGVVSTGAPTPGLFGFQHPETTPTSIPTTSQTAPMSVPRHTHTREDEAYFVPVGKLEVTVRDEVFVRETRFSFSSRAIALWHR